MSIAPRPCFAICTTLLVSVGLPVPPALGQEAELPLQAGITGSTPRDPNSNPTAILASADVQRLILEIAEQPKPRGDIEAAIAGESFSVDDLVNVGLLREQNGLYWIDFNLLRVSDQQAIIETSEQLGRDLAMAFLARRRQFEKLAAAHDQPGVGPAELFYIVLGCFSLDWDGLDFTEMRGYRDGAQRTIGGQSFTPWAKERGAGVSLKGLFWGSHNRTRADFTFTTFGDHHSLPRFGLPDMLWNSSSAFSRYQDHPDAQRAAGRMVSAYRGDALDDIAAVMRLLRSRDRSEAALAAETGLRPRKLARILDLLEAAEYVAHDADTIRGRVLVLTPDDADMVRAMLAEGRDIMAAWHEENYESIRSQLSHLTPMQNGVPFERVYTEVWHFVFGIANRILAERGFFADPYAEGRTFKGFIPAIWANGLDEW